MRGLPAGLASALETETLTLAHAWILRRRDGLVVACTDHDRDVTVAGALARAGEGFVSGQMEKSAALNVDTAAAAGALSSSALAEADLAGGLWDGASVEVWRFDWRAPANAVLLLSGALGEVRRGPMAFTAEIRGLQARLNTALGRVYSRFCDAELGDPRCSVDLGAWTAAATVVSVSEGRTLTVSGLGGWSAGTFSRGRVTLADGRIAPVESHLLIASGVALQLFEAPAGAPIAPGAVIQVSAGCDKRQGTCATRFANIANFRGFPHLPGNDAVQAGPSGSDPLDGSSRWT